MGKTIFRGSTSDTIIFIFLCFVISITIAENDPKINESLTIHNQARAQATGPLRPNLSWSTSLADAAQIWSDHLASIDQLQHSSGTGQGENLLRSIGGPEPSFADAANAWVSEKSKYRGERIPDGDFEGYGHYTQIIWPSTREVGMGRTTSAQGWTYVVARYSPTGNYVGEKPGV
ncbi:hypothetical protein K3495_g9088 [Podosphaera aphanis]|nr:hypothetical protein K3495_g9088 [Podosphaera aphanis]